MKILFTDIDGVLTSIDRGNSYECGDPSKYVLDPQCMNYFKYLLNNVPELKVVIHSNWRKYLNNEHLINGKLYHSLMPRLIELLGDRYLGHPDHSFGNNKSGDILNYLSIKKFDNLRIAVIDDSLRDELNKLPYNSKFIWIDPKVGLTFDNVSELINYFH